MPTGLPRFRSQGQRLQNLRKLSPERPSQELIANKLKVTRSLISQIESGIIDIPLGRRATLAKAYGISEEELERLRTEKSELRPIREIYLELIDRQREAQTVFIVNTCPHEALPLHSTNSEKLKSSTIDHLRQSADVTYTFCVPEEDYIPRNLWQGFFLALRNVLGTKTEAQMKEWNMGHRLRVFTIPAIHCLYPTVVCDAPDPEKMDGWVWFAPSATELITKVPKSFLEAWMKKYYLPINNFAFDTQKEVLWTDVASKIMKSLGEISR